MTPLRVLSVGQCGFDHSRIARHLEQSFRAQVRGVSTFDEALDALRSGPYDLVLVNRVNDLDGAPGLDLIRSVKADARLADVPIMLVSNYPEAQSEAQALGALLGFGKSNLNAETTRARLGAVLGSPSSPGTSRVLD
jgi:two-component system chemotaxis response regulator CheY